MKICVIGGTGNISRAVVRAGVAAGHEMTVINRGTRQVDFGGPVAEIIADRKDAEGFAAAVKDVSADVVIHMIAYGEILVTIQDVSGAQIVYVGGRTPALRLKERELVCSLGIMSVLSVGIPVDVSVLIDKA